MRLSIIIPVLDSHEVLRRQLLYFERIGFPAETELIIVDDGSDPPLMEHDEIRDLVRDFEREQIQILETNDKRPWTWALARNAGAKLATGEYLLFFDLDHIVTRELLDFVHGFQGHKVQFIREIAVLTESGILTQDREILEDYGIPQKNDLKIGPLPNNFAMRRDLYWELGGYREDLVERAYPQGEDRLWKKTWYEYQRSSGNTADAHRPTIYCFPTGKMVGDVDYNPQGLFHNLSRKTNRNHWYQEQKRREGGEG
jgi:glycosyltransferase involved in cell wall biosynthesis